MTRVVVWFVGSVPVFDAGLIIEVDDLLLFEADLRSGQWMMYRTPESRQIHFDSTKVIAWTDTPKEPAF